MTSSYGATIPVMAGTKKYAGNVIWQSSRREVATTTTQSTGGKFGGGGSTATTTTYRYYRDFAILFGEGEASALRKLWIDGALKYDVSSSATSNSVAASALNATAIRFYPGSETQEIDPTISAFEGVDAPAYRGYVVMVVENMDVTDYGGRAPQIEAEIVCDGSVAATLDISAGTAVSTTSVVDTSSPIVLGANGNIWAKGVVSNTAVMMNFYANVVQVTYTRTLWGYRPADVKPGGQAAVFNNSGGFFGYLNDDGSVTEYSGAATLGLNGLVAWIDTRRGYAQGDGSSTSNLRYFILDFDDESFVSALLTDARSTHLFKNATGISGRCYCYGSTTYSHDWGYIATASNSKVLLGTGTAYAPLGLLVSDAGDLWMARATTGTDVEKRSEDGALIGSVAIPSGTVARLFEAPDGMIWAWVSAGAIYCIHPTTLDIVYTSANTGTKTPLGFTTDGRMILWSTSGANFLLHEVERLPRVTAAPTSLDDFIEEQCAKVGLTSTDLDLSELASDELDGYSYSRMPLRSALEPLATFYRFNAIESDYQIKFKKRGSASVVSIPEDDLAAHFDGEETPALVATVRKLETELPREVAVNFIDPATAYEIGATYARRLTGQSSEIQSIDLPIVMSASDGAQAAQYLLGDAWAARTAVELNLSMKYAWLEPGDVITVTAGGIEYTLRILEITQDRGLLKLKTVTEDSEILNTTATGASGPAAEDEISAVGPTVLRVLDIPLLRDVDDGAGIYVAATGLYDGWQGAELFMSRDSGVTWERTQTVFLTASVIGTATTVLPDFLGGNVFDEISTVDIQVINGELFSASEELVRGGENTCYLGGELVSFKSAELVETDRYRLSGLRRGRKGTEQYMSTHAIGDSFVLLDQDAVRRLTLTNSDIGAALQLKAVTIGQQVAEATAIPVTPAGVGLEPLSPTQIRAGRTASASWDITIAWTRRNRLDAEWRNFGDVPQSESTEAYVVEIYTNSTFGTVKRTISGLSSATTTYTSAQQVTDFGSNQTTIYVKVYQVSSVTGNGFAGTATLTV